MKKALIFTLLAIFAFSSSFGQNKTVSGKSQSTRLVIKPDFKRGLPPDLYVAINFSDDNNNGILEPNETFIIKLSITNKGKGPAQGLLVKLKDSYYDPDLDIRDGKKIPYLYSGQTAEVEIKLHAGFNIKSAEHRLEIVVTEHYGYDMDAAYLVLNTMEYLEPELVFSGLEVIDIGSGTGAIIEDGQLQAGEQVKVKIVVQNIGQNIAKNTEYYVRTTDKNIYLSNYKGSLGDLAIGEVKEFWITISPNKRVSTSSTLPIFLSVQNTHGKGNIEREMLPIKLNQRPPEPEIVKVEVDIESIQRKVVRFETESNKITANIANIIDIRQVPPSKTHRNNSVAIVMGIEKYDNFAPAPYAANDANIIKDYFKYVLGVDKVFTFTNNDVSGFFFDNKFNPDYGELQKAIIKGETDLFVFYSGHGMPSKDGTQVFLFPSDGRIEALNRQGYDLNTFYNNLASLDARSTTIFIDACFSGVSRASETRDLQNLVVMKGVYLEPNINEPWETDPNFTVFSSSSYEETSLGFDPSETGLFTYFLCAGLQGKADANLDNKITTGELKNYVIKNVSEISVKILGRQTPVFYGNEDIILGEY